MKTYSFYQDEMLVIREALSHYAAMLEPDAHKSYDSTHNLKLCKDLYNRVQKDASDYMKQRADFNPQP